MPEPLTVEAKRLRHDLERIRREDLTPDARATLQSLLGELEQLQEGASSVTDAAVDLEAIRRKALREPIDVDISDYGDEWCAGFLAGQENGITALAPEVERLHAQVAEMERQVSRRVTMAEEIERRRDAVRPLLARLKAQAEVIEAMQVQAAKYGVTLTVLGGSNDRLTQALTALARLDADEHAQRNAQAVTQLQADMEAKA